MLNFKLTNGRGYIWINLFSIAAVLDYEMQHSVAKASMIVLNSDLTYYVEGDQDTLAKMIQAAQLARVYRVYEVVID